MVQLPKTPKIVFVVVLAQADLLAGLFALFGPMCQILLLLKNLTVFILLDL